MAVEIPKTISTEAEFYKRNKLALVKEFFSFFTDDLVSSNL